MVRTPRDLHMPAFLSGPRSSARLRGVREISGERIGTALRKLAEDLVIERRRVAQLERENRELAKQLEQLRRAVAERDLDAALSS